MVSQLDQDTSAALATIREWRNSFIPINRVPLDVLSLIPTHLSSNCDVFYASFVCRHWRRTFIQRAGLWSRLYVTMSKADSYVKTLLERSKGSTLDIIASRDSITLDPVCADLLALLSPHAQRIGKLDFVHNRWADVQEFSNVISGPLPLLRTLEMNIIYESNQRGPAVMAPPSLPLFPGAINLKEFRLRSMGLPCLDHFIFPNLTTLELSATPAGGFPGSRLLSFLEASPTLWAIHIKIAADVLLGDVPLGRVVVLPNVETFDLTISRHGSGCNIAAHISCPSARSTSLLYKQDADSPMSPEIFPTSVAWNAIACQYSASPVNEVVLEIMTARGSIITCSLTFLSPGPAVLVLGFEVIAGYGDEEDEDDDGFEMPLEQMYAEIFSQASTTIRTHPLLANVKCLRIRDKHMAIYFAKITQIASAIEQLFKPMGPLDTLTLDVIDLQPYLAPFLRPSGFRGMGRRYWFPPVKELTIVLPPQASAERDYFGALEGLAKLQHTLGVPFERVTIHVKNPPLEVAGWLQPWVDAVHFCDEMPCAGDDG